MSGCLRVRRLARRVRLVPERAHAPRRDGGTARVSVAFPLRSLFVNFGRNRWSFFGLLGLDSSGFGHLTQIGERGRLTEERV